jgi:CHAT domain-containing protein
MADVTSSGDSVPDPIEGRLARVREHTEHTDERLRRLMARIESGDRVAERVQEALLGPDPDSPVDPALMEIDTWWRLHDVLNDGNRQIDQLKSGLGWLATSARRWGDNHGAETFTNLRALLSAVRDTPLDRILETRAVGHSELVPRELRPLVLQADAAALAYLRDRQAARLSGAHAAHNDILMSDMRMRAEPSLQLALFCDAGVIMRDLYNLASDPVLLDRQIRCWQACLQLFRDPSVFPSSSLLNLAPRLDLVVVHLAAALTTRFHQHHKKSDLDESVQQSTAAVVITLPDAPVLSARLAGLGRALGVFPDEESVAYGCDLLYFAAVLERDPDQRSTNVAQFVTQCYERHERFQTGPSLDAVFNAWRIIERWPDDQPTVPLPEQVRLGLERLAEGGQESLIGTQALKRLATTSDTDYAIDQLSSLATQLLNAYPVENDILLLDQAADALEQVLAHAPTASPQRRAAIVNLATCLTERYQRCNKASDLQRVIDVLTEALAANPDDASFLDSFGGALMLRHRLTGSTDDLTRAIEFIGRALRQIPPGPSEQRGRYLTSLAVALLDRWNLTSDAGDVDRALEAIGESLETTIARPRRVELLTLKLTCLQARYQSARERRDLDESLDLCHTLLDDLAAGAKERSAVLHQLGAGFRARYALEGDSSTLTQAVAAFRDAVAAGVGDPQWPEYVSDLGTALSDRYDATGDLQDLQDAIEAHEQALAAAGPGSAGRVLILGHLSTGLLTRGRRTHHLADIDAALARAREAVDLCPVTSRLYVISLNGLATALFERYRWESEAGPAERPDVTADDLREAVTTYERLVQMPSGRSPTYLNNLGMALTAVYLRDADADALNRAIQVLEATVAGPTMETTDLPRYWLNLAIALKNRVVRSGDPADMDAARNAFRLSCDSGRLLSPEVVLHAARAWGDWALSEHSFAEAAEAYGHGLDAIQDLVRGQVTRAQKEIWLKEAEGLPVRAAYARARTGENAIGAVEALERGRALVMSEALEINRAELGRLGATHPELEARYQRTATRWTQLSTSPPSGDEGLGGKTLAEALRASRDELEAVIAEIRTVDGYVRFMKPIDFAEIVDAAGEAPLVYIGSTTQEGFALIVDPRERSAVAVWLAELSEARVAEHVERYALAYARYRSSLPRKEPDRQFWWEALDAITAWAWDAAMSQVLRALGDATEATLVPVGLLGFVPLHAAWMAEPSNGRTRRRYALDTVAWKYAPNARALAGARSAAATVQNDRLLVVDSPSAERVDLDLPFSHAEVSAAVATFPDHQVYQGESATRENLRAAWSGAACVHLSCHGWADFVEPLESGLVLAGEERLRLREILSNRLGARLVVLSSCESGILGGALPDEVVSLPAGLLQAGSAAAVASLWTVSGRATALLMFRFYELWRSGAAVSAAEGLRQAQIWVRDTTNAEKASYFQARLPGAGHAVSSLGAQMLWRDLFNKDPLARDESHPYYWAAFTYVGL